MWRDREAAQAASAADATRAAKGQEQQQAGADTVLSTIEEARSIMGKSGPTDIIPEAGILGGRLGQLGLNQEAVDLRAKLSTLGAAIGFGRLERMREASKTGGALGAVSERELELLMADLGSLDQMQSASELNKTLARIEATYTKIKSDPVASQYLSGGDGTPLIGGGQAGDVVIEPIPDADLFKKYGVN